MRSAFLFKKGNKKKKHETNTYINICICSQWYNTWQRGWELHKSRLQAVTCYTTSVIWREETVTGRRLEPVDCISLSTKAERNDIGCLQNDSRSAARRRFLLDENLRHQWQFGALVFGLRFSHQTDGPLSQFFQRSTTQVFEKDGPSPLVSRPVGLVDDGGAVRKVRSSSHMFHDVWPWPSGLDRIICCWLWMTDGGWIYSMY